MVSRHSGHFVQVFKPLGPYGYHEYVEVEGRTTARSVTAYPAYVKNGWFTMSRELSRKEAIRFAKAYKRAGFKSRVLFIGNDQKWNITDTFSPK